MLYRLQSFSPCRQHSKEIAHELCVCVCVCVCKSVKSFRSLSRELSGNVAGLLRTFALALGLAAMFSESLAQENPIDHDDCVELDTAKEFHEAMYALSGVAFSNLPMFATTTEVGGGIYTVSFYQVTSSFSTSSGASGYAIKDATPIASGIYIASQITRATSSPLVQSVDPTNPSSLNVRMAISHGTLTTDSGTWSVWTQGGEAFIPANGASAEQVVDHQLFQLSGVFGLAESPVAQARLSGSMFLGGLGIGIEFLNRAGFLSPCGRQSLPPIGENLKPPTVPNFQACEAIATAAKDTARLNFDCAKLTCVTEYMTAFTAQTLGCLVFAPSGIFFAICHGAGFTFNTYALVRCKSQARSAKADDDAHAAGILSYCKMAHIAGAP
jgi:hypothetical protein